MNQNLAITVAQEFVMPAYDQDHHTVIAFFKGQDMQFAIPVDSEQQTLNLLSQFLELFCMAMADQENSVGLAMISVAQEFVKPIMVEDHENTNSLDIPYGVNIYNPAVAFYKGDKLLNCIVVKEGMDQCLGLCSRFLELFVNAIVRYRELESYVQAC